MIRTAPSRQPSWLIIQIHRVSLVLFTQLVHHHSPATRFEIPPPTFRLTVAPQRMRLAIWQKPLARNIEFTVCVCMAHKVSSCVPVPVRWASFLWLTEFDSMNYATAENFAPIRLHRRNSVRSFVSGSSSSSACITSGLCFRDVQCVRACVQLRLDIWRTTTQMLGGQKVGDGNRTFAQIVWPKFYFYLPGICAIYG